MTEELSRYIEDVALFFEELGLPRIAGRIVGHLLVCDPPHRTAAQLIRELRASKASVSQMTRYLIQAGLLERFAVRGERATLFRITDDGFEALFGREITTLTAFGDIAERGIGLVGPDEGADRLRKLRAFFRFFEEATPELLERWRDERDARIAAEFARER